MQQYKKQFLSYAVSVSALKFGSFQLKSGRQSPYFFNSSSFNSGEAMNKIGSYYAEALIESKLEFDCLFGPAYKGIPLVVATAMALSIKLNRVVPWCFNRKEVKKHGEGGKTVGSPLSGKIIIIDDVITSGKAITEAINLIADTKGASLTGCLISLDRQEKALNTDLSAVKQIETSYKVPVVSIAGLSDLIAYAEDDDTLKQYSKSMANYRNDFGV